MNEAAVAALLAVIADSHPAAIAGRPDFWACLSDLNLTETTAALQVLAARGIVRRVPVNGGAFYIADPPHATPRPSG